jgi:hypothetical protein
VSEVAEEEEVKLEDILKSIRGMIDEKDPAAARRSNSAVQKPQNTDSESKGEDVILELTDIHEEDENSSFEELLSNQVKGQVESHINEFANHLEQSNYLPSEAFLNSTAYQLMNPLIKDWLDDNLPRIVERVVAEEIRKLIPKK